MMQIEPISFCYKRLIAITGWLLSTLLMFGQAPCEIATSTDKSVLTCSDCATLSVTGLGKGQSVFSEDFNSGSPSGWAFTQQATFNNPCSPNGVDGTTHIWMGNNSPVPRALETNGYNVSSATAGVTICFDLLFAEQGDAAPCEGPDEPDEGVYLQYSIDGGNTWVDIHYFDPNGGNDPDLVNWNNWCFALPAAAVTTNTKIRWFQDNDSGADYDHWGIDNVNINFNDPTYEITWLHDNYSYGQGNSGGANPTPVCPTTTTQYIATISNGINTCRDTVTITVPPSSSNADAGGDTTICSGDCVTLNGVGEIILNPGGPRTFTTTEAVSIASFGGIPASVNLNVTDLNMTNVQPGSITSVCFNISDPFGLPPPFPSFMDVSTLDVNLVCPDGTTIPLVLTGEATGTSFGGANIINPGQSTCFTMSASTTIPNGTAPYQGDFVPTSGSSLNDFVGCTANGIWSIQVNSTNSIAVGLVNSWSITFDDPPIYGTPVISWSPSTGITSGGNTATPTICPTTTTTYTMSVSDLSGCAPSSSDQVTITVQSVCCNVTVDNVIVTDPNCGNNDGSLIIAASGGTSPYTYSIDGGNTFQNSPAFFNIGDGTYNIVVEDATGCQGTFQQVLAGTPAVTIFGVTPTDASCGLINGSLNINAAGGTGSLGYTIDTGLNVQSANVFNNLDQGTYQVIVTDQVGCADTQVVMIGSSSSITLTITNTVPATCGNTDGSVTVAASGGAMPYTYTWSNNQTGPTATGLAAGNYSVVAQDANGCQATLGVTVFNLAGPTITSIVPTQPSCGASDGSLVINITGGITPFTFSIDGGNTTQNNGTFNNLPAGTYDIVVTDGNGCQVTDQEVLANSNGVSIDSVIVNASSCGQSDGTLTVVPDQLLGSSIFSIDGGNTFQPGPDFTGLQAGTYVVVYAIGSGCSDTATVTITDQTGPSISLVNITQPSCGASDGTITVSGFGNATPLSYSIDGGSTFQASGSFSGLASGTYNIVVEDTNGCQATDVALLNNGNGPVIDTVIATQPNCGANDGSIAITASGGSSPLNYSIDGGNTFQAGGSFTGLGSGTYNIIVEDANGCQAADQEVLTGGNALSITNVAVTNTSCGLDNGALDVTITGGNPPVGYSIDMGVTIQPTGQFTGLASGVYLVGVGDGAGCLDTQTVVIAPSSAVVLTLDNTTDANCGQADGDATVSATGGSMPYTFNWSDNQTGTTATGLAAGGYQVTVQDNAGCRDSLNVSISNIGGPTLAITDSVDAVCGQPTGSATVTPTGGTLPYTYLWSNNTTDSTAINLAPGNYFVTVTDGAACVGVASVTIGNSGSITVTANAVDAGCGGNNGIAFATGAGGQFPYTYNWSNNSTGDTINGLAPDIYTVTATDAQGCTATASATVNVSGSLGVTTFSTDVFCGQGNGTAVVTPVAQAGTPPYTFNWDNAETDSLITGLLAGTYTVTSSDVNGCSAVSTITITDLPGPTVSSSYVEDSCGESIGEITIDVTGGTAPYTFEWSHDASVTAATATGLEEGFYTVTVTDSNNCPVIESIDLPCVEDTIVTIFIPNAFSPNGDGANDFYQIYGEGIVTVNFKIFDRWGELVFQSEDPEAQWDGTFKGKALNPGVFVYDADITFKNRTFKRYYGSILLIK